MAYNRDRGNRSGGGDRNFGRPRFNNDRHEMYSATCANCGKQCEVPFRPTGSKPVLCRECFQNNRGSDSGRPERSSSNRPRFNNNDDRSTTNDYSVQFAMLNTKIDKILDLLQSPSDAAPLEEDLNEKVLEEVADEMREEKEIEEKKPKKAKTKKEVSSKNK